MFKIISVFSAVTFLVLLGFLFILFSQTTKAQENLFVSPLAGDNKKVPTKLKPVFKERINILLLGLDARKGDKNPRCDAIHMLTFDNLNSKIIITSVPRGTEIQLSKNRQDINYLSNYCHNAGIDAAARQIEKITGIHPDYIVKIGFSQTLGILRNLNIPTTSTLQFLRSRNTALGDYQRSHNQAVFLKDMIAVNIDKISQLPEFFKYLIYKMIDTDMPFDVAQELLYKIKDSQIGGNPDSIKLTSKPDNFLSLKDVHLRQADKKWANDKEFVEYQNGLNIYLKTLLGRVEAQIKNSNNTAAFALLKTPFSQQIWLQVENEKLRNEYHFALLKDFVQTSPDNEKLPLYILDFISEMEINRQDELKTKAENLLKNII